MDNEKNQRARKDIPVEFKWKLEDIYPTDADWEKDFNAVPKLVERIVALQGKLAESAAHLLQALNLQDHIGQIVEKVFTFARMRRDEDNTNANYQALTDRAIGLSTRVHSATSFVVPEILAIPADVLQRFQQEEHGLDLYRFALEDLMRQKPHILSAGEEAILAQAGELAQVPSNVFAMINNADIKFPAIIDENGQKVEITHGRYLHLMESPERRVRKDVFEGLYSTYKKQENTLAATLSSVVKRDVFFARVRKHPSALEASLFADNVKTEVYDNLIQTVRDNVDAMHRYVRLRKKLLGLSELRMYDLYVPIIKDVQWKIPYGEAVEMVKKGLNPLGEDYGKVLAEGFSNRWVDVYENKGKTSGAYSWGPYGVHPFVLMNYQDNLNNVFTLAHEMGHAMHSYYSHKEQPYVYAQYKIFVAEVASTVNESLLMDYLLKTVTDKGKKMYLVNHCLEQFRGTVYRQTMFAEFEKMIHAKVEAGEALTPEGLREIYHNLNVDYYGPDMVVDEDIDIEWARIPHFYSNFYVYKYATGFSAATSLTQQILKEGEPAVERYLTFLKSGGSGYPIELLKKAGVDMGSPQAIQQGLGVFRSLLDQMEALANE